MPPALLILVLLALTSTAFYLGRRRSLRIANGSVRVLHSLPAHYGFYTALWCGIPAILVFSAWFAFEPSIVTKLVVAELPEAMRELPESRRSLLINDIKNVLEGHVPVAAADPEVATAAERYRHLQGVSTAALAVCVLSLAIAGGAYALRGIRADLRARNRVEAVIRGFLILSSTIAIFTTLGIVLSILSRRSVSSGRFRSPSFSSGCSGARRRPYESIRSAARGPSAPCRSSPAPCSSPGSPWRWPSPSD